MNLKKAFIIAILVIFVVAGIKSLWDIDIAVGSKLSSGQIITITGVQDFNFWYHRALIINFISFVGLFLVTLTTLSEYWGVKNG